MSSVIKLSQQLASLSQQLIRAKENDDVEAQERIEDEIDEVSEQLDELTSFDEHQDYR